MPSRRFLTIGALLLIAAQTVGLEQFPAEVEWFDEFGSAGGTIDFGQAAAADGHVYVVGYVGGSLPDQNEVTVLGVDAFVRKYDAAGDVVWTRQFGAIHAQATAVAVDSSGVYVAGHVIGALPGQEQPTINRDAFVRKYDHEGIELWTRQFGGGFTEALGIAAADSGIYVAGFVVGDLPGQFGRGFNNAFVRKYDPEGTEQWTRQLEAFPFGNYTHARTVTANASGIYVAGFTSGEFFGQPSAGANDAFLARLDPAGNTEWIRQFGTAGQDTASGVSIEGSSVFVVGRYRPTSDRTEAFVRAFDTNGSPGWTHVFTPNGSFPTAEAIGVGTDPSGVYITGYTSAALPGQPYFGGTDAFVRKYTLSGQVVWTDQFGAVREGRPLNDERDEAVGIAADSGGVFAVGFTTGTLAGQTGDGREDVFVRRYDAAGGETWTRQFGSSSVTSLDTVVATSGDGMGNVYVAGTTEGALPDQTRLGERDAFVRKYDSVGRLLWTRQFGQGNVSEAATRAFGLAIDPTGVYVVGRSVRVLDEAFMWKFDGDGTPLWTRRVGDSGFSAEAIVAYEGALYVAGTGRLRKFDADGNELWSKPFMVPGSRPFPGHVTDISADLTGIYVLGKDPTGFRSPPFARKYTLDGSPVWLLNFARCFGNLSQCHEAYGIEADGDGFYVAGQFRSVSKVDTFLHRYTPDGVEAWTRLFDSNGITTLGEKPGDLAADASGAYVTSGVCGKALLDQTFLGACDLFVRKYDRSGNEHWTRQFGGARSEWGHAISVDARGIYVGGIGDVAVSGTVDTQAMIVALMNPLAIDIKPGSAANPVKGRNGVVPVAVLTTAALDATTLDASTACFGAERADGMRICSEAHGKAHFEDVDKDGDTDVVLHYDRASVNLETGATTACLTGRTFAGVPVKGCDSVQVR